MKVWLVAGALFVIALSVRLVGLNLEGRTWDEYAYIGKGFDLWQFIRAGDWSNPEWYVFPDHPPLARYVYGLAAQGEIIGTTSEGRAVFTYDWTGPRVAAAVISSLTAGVLVLFGAEFLSLTVGVFAGLLYSLLPLSIAYGRLASLEPFVTLTFTLSVYAYMRYVHSPSRLRLLVAMLAFGMALATKYTNVLAALVMLVLTLVLERALHQWSRWLGAWLLVVCGGLVVFVLFWPAWWTHPVNVANRIIQLSSASGSPAELFMGKYTAVPFGYYLVYFLITTPLLVLGFFVRGMRISWRQNRRFFWVLLLWFLLPFIQSFYPLRRNGIRYIIEIYAPLSLLAGIGVESFWRQLRKLPELRGLLCTLGATSLLLMLFWVFPYYLDYYNVLVGGPQTVYAQRWFSMGWWGEGQREALLVIAGRAKPNDVVGLAVVPDAVAPVIDQLHFGLYRPDQHYDFVVLNALYESERSFDRHTLEHEYVEVYQVTAGGAPIVRVYQKR